MWYTSKLHSIAFRLLVFIRTDKKWILSGLLILAGLSYCYYRFKPTELYIPGHFNPEDYSPFEPEVFTDFNKKVNATIKIQRIIHQTWKNEKIPPEFVQNIKTFVKNNPTWQYYLWTDDSARELILDYYPWLLPVWDGIMYSTDTMRRADALRYVVLYHYGGIYADLDTVCYRSLDNAITKHPCVFTPEPFEHSVFRAFVPFLINNAVMLCSAKHPFLKQLINNLHKFEHFTRVVDATGPGYVTAQYQLYNNLVKESHHLILYNNRSLEDLSDDSPYFYKGHIPVSDPKSVYIANTRYFLHSLDDTSHKPLYKECKLFHSLNHLQKRACVNAKRLGLSRQPNEYVFVDHQWKMTWVHWKKSLNMFTVFFNNIFSVPIRSIVPYCKIYASRKNKGWKTIE